MLSLVCSATKRPTGKKEKEKMIPRALTIAGSDSGGGAGIQADLKTFSAFGVYGMSVLTAITAQNTVRVDGVEGMPAEFVGLQFDAVSSDIGVDAVKTGMLLNAKIIGTVVERLKRANIRNIVVDPVMVTTGGDPLLEEDAVKTIKDDLMPIAGLVTPNIPEAEILAGMKIIRPEDMEAAARAIHALGCRAVLVKGGHLTEDAVDVFFDGSRVERFTAERIDSRNTHGTGCTYSAAIAANLAKGKSLVIAIRISKRYITEAIRGGFPLGKGHGPLNHFVRVEGMDD